MKDSFYFKLSVQIVFIFATIIAVSFVADQLHDFLGDTYCKGRLKTVVCGEQRSETIMIGCYEVSLEEGLYDGHNPKWHWGYRHFVWMWGVLCLFIVQVVRVVFILIQKNKT